MGLTRLEHLLVLTDDIDATRDWYRDVLGFSEGARPPLAFPGHWLYLGDVACIHIAGRAEYAAFVSGMNYEVSPVPDGTGPIDHVAFNGEDHDALVARLESHGVEFIPNTIPGVGIRQLFVRDPNGVTVEINVAPE
jgi:catechol 2,3-dioxygenase-like lactoylglutathione lyase family enzyme